MLGYSLLASGDQWQFEGPEGPVSVKVRARLWSNNGDTCIAACVQGAGIQLQPTFLIDAYLRDGSLVEILPQFRVAPLGIYAVYPTRKHVLPKVRALISFLTDKFEHAPWSQL